MAIAIVCTIAVIALVGALVVVVLKPFDSSDQTGSGVDTEQSDGSSSADDGSSSADEPADSATTSTTEATTTTEAPTTTAPPTTTTTIDVQAAALSQLQATKQADASAVEGVLDYWVPQIASKQVGLKADGIVYQNDTILRNHQNIIDRLGNERVALLWSGDYSTYSGTDFWVTIVVRAFSTSDEVLSWCADNGFDPKNCAAKIVSHTHEPGNSTAYRPGA